MENEGIAEKLFKDVPYKILGKTKIEKEIEVKNIFKADVDDLKKVWQEPMKEMFA